MTSVRSWCLWLIAPVVLVACTSQGPQRVPADRFDYSEAIARSSREQTLMNLVRLRHLDVPIFLDVSSVLTQYGWLGTLGVTGTAGLGGASDTLSNVGGNAEFNYLERPTITYSPLSGVEFTRRLLEPVALQSLFAASYSGLPSDLLWMMGLQEVNGVSNVAVGPKRSILDDASGAQEDRRKYEAFKDLMLLMGRLRRLDAIEFQRDPDKGALYLVIAKDVPPAAEPSIQELRTLLELDPSIHSFLITGRTAGRRPDEITMEARSLLAMMNFLARGIDLPATKQMANTDTTGIPVPLRVRTRPAAYHSTSPTNAFVAIKYRGHWYYIEDNESDSKLAFGLLRYLFQLKAAPTEKQAPLITVPVGG